MKENIFDKGLLYLMIRESELLKEIKHCEEAYERMTVTKNKVGRDTAEKNWNKAKDDLYEIRADIAEYISYIMMNN